MGTASIKAAEGGTYKRFACCLKIPSHDLCAWYSRYSCRLPQLKEKILFTVRSFWTAYTLPYKIIGRSKLRTVQDIDRKD
jgi:hypothetical protein